MAVTTIEQNTEASEPSPEPAPAYPWSRALIWAALAYALSRAAVIAGAGAVSAAQKPRPTSGTGPILDVLNSWDGAWYYEVARHGYPHHIPPNITFFQLEARAAFFPLFPRVVWAINKVVPGGDVVAALGLNLLLGAVFVLLVGLMTRRLFGNKVASRAMVLTALFPGSFVLSFAYSEAIMLVLVAGCLLFLMQRRWLLAGILAGLATASRPNAIAIVASCVVAAIVAIVQRREWKALLAPLLAPVGWISFQLFLAHQTGERDAWFRVQGRGLGRGHELRADGHQSDRQRLDPPARLAPQRAHVAVRRRHAVRAVGHVEATAPAAGHRLHDRDPGPDAPPPDRHGAPALPLHRVPAPDLGRRGLAGQATTRCGRCSSRPAAPASRP